MSCAWQGLGQRVANLFVQALGKSTLGLAYGLSVAEGLISPAMPSTSARAGGIFVPIIKSLSEASGCDAEHAYNPCLLMYMQFLFQTPAHFQEPIRIFFSLLLNTSAIKSIWGQSPPGRICQICQRQDLIS